MGYSTEKPRPEMVQAEQFIASEGIKHPTLTMHTFYGFKLEPDPEFGWVKPQWAVQYRCTITKVIRKYGVIDATPASDIERKNEEYMQ